MLPQNRQEESFSFGLMRQETVNREILTSQIAGNAPTFFDGYGQYLRSKFFCYPCYIILVFLTIESTSAVYQESPRLQRRPNICQDTTLALPTNIHILYTPFLYGYRILAEHTFAGTRYVGQNHIEQMGQLREICRIIIRNNHLRMSPLNEVLRQDLRTVAHHFISDQQTALRQSTS